VKIVVRGTNWVGDAVMTIPALRELRRIFPDAHISLHTRTWAEGIFQDADFIDDILPFQVEKTIIQNIHKQARIWQEKNFDLAVIFTNSFESALLAKLGKVPKRFGYAKEARSVLLTNAIKMPDWKNQRHEIFYYLNLVAEIEQSYFGKTTTLENEPRFELNVSSNRKADAKKFLEENGVDLSKKIVAFVTGSTNSHAKRWQTEKFALLNDFLQNKLDSNVILIGAKNELVISNEVVQKSELKPINLTGKTTIAEVTAILSVCDLLVANDTGPAHISAALGTKTLVIFGPTNPKTTQPWNSEIIRREDVDCSPCMLRDCPIDHRCMEWIPARDVFEKVSSLI
jgi:heptosyltransferase-2